MSTTAWPFIEMDDNGRPCIQRTGLKVLLLIREHLVYDWDAELLRRQHPHLTLAEIHAALGYYYEQRTACDLMLEREDQQLESLRSQLVDPALQERLRLARDLA